MVQRRSSLHRAFAVAGYCVGAVALSASLVDAAAGDVGQKQAHASSPSHHVTAQHEQHDIESSSEYATDEEDQQRRRRAQTSAETFAYYTSSKIRSAIPLDLKIDERSGEVFVRGHPGLVASVGEEDEVWLSYAEMFANSNGGSVGDGGGVDGKGINVEGGNSIFSKRSPSNSEEETPTISLSSIMSGDDTNQYDDHVQSPHASSFTRYEHVKEEYERHAMESVVEMVEERGGLRGRRLTSDAGEDVPSKVVSSFKIDLSSIEFKPSSEQKERVLPGGLPQEVDDEDSSAMITFGTKDKKKDKEKAAKQKVRSSLHHPPPSSLLLSTSLMCSI